MSSHFGRTLGSCTPASRVAVNLFVHFVLVGEDKATNEAIEHYSAVHESFDKEAFRRKTFMYLVACVVVAMSKQQSKRNVLLALDHFRYLATQTMFSRWRVSETDAAGAIIQAAESLRTLCFNPLHINPSFAFDWSRAWLSEIGVDETSSALLVQIAQDWKEMMIFVLDYLDQAKIGGG